MEKVDSFIRDLREREKFQSEKFKKDEIKRTAEETEIIKDLVETTDNFIQTRENVSKNLNFLTLNKHSIHKISQESETTKGLPISFEYQQQAMDLLTNSITFMNNFEDMERILEADKSLELSDPAKDLVDCTKTIENELKRVRTVFIQTEALHSKVEQLKSTLFIPEGENHQELDDSVIY